MKSDGLSIHSPMGDILGALPGARRALFARYHLGGCSSCGFPPEESLAQLAQRTGNLDPGEMLARLLEAHELDLAMLVSPAKAKAMLDSENPPRLVDTRTREEHEAVAIPGSEFMTETLQQALFAGDPQRAILLYDHAGHHVLDHCSWFQGHGLGNTRALEGGIDAWSREIDPSLPRYRLEIE